MLKGTCCNGKILGTILIGTDTCPYNGVSRTLLYNYSLLPLVIFLGRHASGDKTSSEEGGREARHDRDRQAADR